MPEGASLTIPSAPAGGGAAGAPAIPAGTSDHLDRGDHSFSRPPSHSARLARTAALATGLLACLTLWLGLAGRGGTPTPLPPGAPAAPAQSVERGELDLPILAKPAHSDISRFHAEAEEVAPEPPKAAEPAAEPPRADARPAGPVAPPAAGTPVEFAGIWGPNGAACSPRANRGGYLPAVITAEGAFAGETSCSFRNAKAVAGGWTVSATCANPKGRWATQVRLVVAGNRLTWSSPRGTQTYVRCGAQRAGAAPEPRAG